MNFILYLFYIFINCNYNINPKSFCMLFMYDLTLINFVLKMQLRYKHVLQLLYIIYAYYESEK